MYLTRKVTRKITEKYSVTVKYIKRYQAPQEAKGLMRKFGECVKLMGNKYRKMVFFMIVSASRRTDIPTYHSDWFFDRVKEGFVLTRNPMNHNQIREVSLRPDEVSGIVFWTKNPLPMTDRLDELENYMYYFQFSVTPYGKDIELNLPRKNNEILSAFKGLADKIGPDRVIWRYDPILINEKYSADYHVRAFERIAREFQGFTKKVVISFIDRSYRNVKRNLKELALIDLSADEQDRLASRLAEIARSCGLSVEACAQDIDLAKHEINPAKCIDDVLLSNLLGYKIDVKKDRNQRSACGCAASVDIGVYNTCLNGCRYCYANWQC